MVKLGLIKEESKEQRDISNPDENIFNSSYQYTKTTEIKGVQEIMHNFKMPKKPSLWDICFESFNI
jgi:hypothetical protein